MDIRQLRYFTAVVNEGSISGAAKTLHMSQPPLSTQIRLLEEELGCTLFERNTRHIRLTEAGRLLYDRAGTMLDLISSTKNELNDYRDGLSATLRIGVISSVAGSLFTDWIIGFHRQYPNIKYALYEANTYESIEKIRSSQTDLAFIRTPFHAPDLTCTLLWTDDIVAVGTPGNFGGCSLDFVSLNEMAEKPLILYRRWESIISSAFAAHNLRPKIICINDDARTTVNLAKAGLGIGIVPSSVILPDPDCQVRPIRELVQSTGISIACRKDIYLSTAARLFMNYVQSTADESLTDPDPGK